MTRKLLQWLGAAFVLGLLGAAGFALAVVKDRVRIVVQADAADAGPEPLALLRDDVATLGQDLAQLRRDQGANLQHLGEALEERAAARHADVDALRREVAGLRQQLGVQAASLQQIDRQLGALAAMPVPAAAPTAGASAPVAEPEPSAAPPVEPAVVVAPVGEATAAAKPKGFLSFTLPPSTFAFDREQRYVLVPDLCRVGFDAKSTLHDFSGVTSRVSGQFTADFDDAAGAWRGEVACEAATLVTGVDGRDANLREHLDTTKHPQIRFVIEGFVPAAGGIDVARQTAKGEVFGKMTIRGVTRDLRLPIAIEVDASRRVVVNGQAPLKLSDYGVPVPSQLGLISMQDEVVVWLALRARVQAGEAK